MEEPSRVVISPPPHELWSKKLPSSEMQPGDFEPVGSSSSVAAWPQERTPEAAEPSPVLPAPTQSRMENFRKVKTSEEESPMPFSGLPAGVVEMKVKEGSKIRNLMGFAMSRMGLEATRQIVFSGCGRAVTKTVTCVEIMKRKLGGLHQITKVQYKTLLEVWENKDPQPDGQREHLTVHKNVPSICILLSKDPLDPNQMGYQPPDRPEGLWADEGDTPEERSGSSPKGVKRRLAMLPHDEGEEQPAKKPPLQCYTSEDASHSCWRNVRNYNAKTTATQARKSTTTSVLQP